MTVLCAVGVAYLALAALAAIGFGIMAHFAPHHDIETCPPECFCHAEWEYDRRRA